MVDITPGDSGANKGFWRKQLRDRYGKFVEMGREVMFDIELPGVQGKVQAFGKFIGNAEPGLARLEVADNSRIPKGVYLVKSEDITSIEAVLPDSYVKEKLEEVNAPTVEPAPELKAEISGDETKKEIFRYVARVLKEDGRFPIARNSETPARGKNSDVARGAKLAYKKVFDAEPALQEKYKTFENMWEKVFEYSADERTQSPNELSAIPEDMKELNRAYAKHVLGLNPSGMITYYRNAVNGKDTEEESAVGYISLDRDMAYDYNSKKENIQANGRYEIYVKPDEVYGMIGYSEIEDEFGVTIGREVANIPGRVKRVGDLAPVHPEEPWLFDYSDKEFQRGFGSSPFRYFSLISHFNFHPVEPLGDNLQEFLDKYNLTAGDIKAKFDELYGAGAYERYKASGNTVDFNKLKRLFIDVGDGKVALDVPALERLTALSSNPDSDYKDDRLDNHLKILSTLQELTGQPFFTHRTRDYTPPEPVEQAPTETEPEIAEPPIVEPEPEKAPYVSVWDGLPFSPEHMEDNGDTAYLIREPDPPAVMYHVAPAAAREDILKNGLDPKNETWNTGLGKQGDDIYRDEHLWTKNDDGEYWAYEYRPIGVYMFADLESALQYASSGGDIYKIDTASNGREIIRDPVNSHNWNDLMDEEKTYVTRYVQPESLQLIENSTTEPAPSESESSGIIPPGYQNWLSSMSDILELENDEDSEDDFDPDLGNKLLSRVMEKAGYNEKPKVVSSEEFNSIEGETIYRAVTDERFVDQYLNSPKHFAGTGVLGNGTYSTNKKESAEAYAGFTNGDPDILNARMLEMKLSPDAKVLSFNSKFELRQWANENAAKFKEEYKKFGANPGEIHEFDWQINNASDWSNLAIMAGYDAIRVPPDIGAERFTIILNRGKVIANGKS
jgi:hypothetical protein